jgi:hypothetical protein
MICYRLLFLLIVAHQLSAMEPYKSSRVPLLKVLAAKKVHELGLIADAFEQTAYDDILLQEYKVMPNYIIEDQKKRMLANIQRDNSVLPRDKRVKERICTYNMLAYMNKKIR